jgi:hypothetical protein
VEWVLKTVVKGFEVVVIELSIRVEPVRIWV